MIFTVVHITDPHWIHKNFNHGNLEAEWEASNYRELSVWFSHIRDNILPRLFGDINILVHTGDSANFYDYHRKVNIAQQFEQIRDTLIPLLIGEHGDKYLYKFAIPGNHDVERSLAWAEVVKVQGSNIQCKLPKHDHWIVDKFKDCIVERITEGTINSREKIIHNTASTLTVASRAHGIRKGDHVEIYSEDRFGSFKNAFSDWVTTTDFHSIPVTDPESGNTIRIALFNSALQCGKGRNNQGELVDLVEVPSDGIERWIANSRNAPDDKFRIALVHHSPMPNPGLRELRVKRDVLVNSGEFNAAMVRTNVKLVLSGHQHVGDEIYVGMSERVGAVAGNWALPHIESGFLSITGPTLLRHIRQGVNPGFNVIQINIPEDAHVAEIRVRKFRYSQGAETKPQTVKYRLAIKSLSGIHLTEKLVLRRFSLLAKAVDLAYSLQPIEPAERVLDLLSANPVIRKLLHKERTCRRTPNNVSGIYILSVLEPETWWANELTRLFRDSFKEHWDRINRDSTPGHVVFRCSKSLHQGIQLGLANAKALNIAGTMKEINTRNLRYEDADWIAEALGRSKSMLPVGSVSRFGHDIEFAAPANEICKGPSITNIKSGEWDIPFFMEERDSKETSKFEMARIVLWPLNSFKSTYAKAIIDFHEDFGVPLFWLDPKRLKGRRGELRKQIGSYIICTHYDAEGERRQHPIESLFNSVGNVPEEEEWFKASGLETRNNIQKIWGDNGHPASLTDPHLNCVAEFKYLLARPDLFLAADVYAMVAAGLETELVTYCLSLDESCARWLESDVAAGR